MHLRAAAVLFAALAALPAQVTPVAGTGCGQSTTSVQFAPQIGQQIVITNPFVCFLQTALVAIGTAAPTPVPWTGCANTSCPVGVLPIALQFNVGYASMAVQIPNDPGLIGFCFRAQTACMSATCISPDRAVDICVQ